MAAERFEPTDNVGDADPVSLDAELLLAGQELDDGDRRLLAGVAATFDQVDPVPPHLVPRIEYEITLASLFDDLDRLQELTPSTSGARTAAEQIRTVTFSGTEVSLMLTLSEVSPTEVRVDGWVAPGEGWTVEVHLPGQSQQRHTTGTDEHGRFAFACLPAALAQFTLNRAGDEADQAVTTPPIEL